MTLTSDINSPLDLLSVFRALPRPYIVVSPEFTILEASDAYLASTLKDRSIIGKYLFDVFPDNPDLAMADGVLNWRQSLEYARDHKVTHKMALQRYDVTRPEALGGGFEEKYWQPCNIPVLDAEGNVLYLVHDSEDVTEAVKSNQLVERQQTFIKSITSISGGATWEYDFATNLVSWDESFSREYGYPLIPHGESFEKWQNRIHPDDLGKISHVFTQALKKRDKIWSAQYRLQKADSSFVQVLNNAYVFYDANGAPLRIAGMVINLDKWEEKEKQAKENLERFELMAKATNDVIWDWNLENDTIWWNDGFKVTFGYKEEDIEHDVNSWYGRIHPNDAERVVEGIHKVIDGSETNWQDEYRFRKADGSYADIFDRGIIARDVEGNPVRMIGAMLDVTERNRVAEELRSTGERVQVLLENIPEIAWVAQMDGYIYYYNKAWYEYTGNNRPDEGWDNVVHPDDLEATLNAWIDALSSGQEYVHEARLRRASDGEYRWFAMRANPLHDHEGNIHSWIGVDTDIQDQKDIQAKLKERDEYVQRMLAQAPVQFAVLKGPDWMGDFATPQFTQLVGGRDIVGKPFREALPELKTQGFFDYIESVYATGKLYRGRETPAYLDRNNSGNLELGYFDFTYQPLFNEHHQVEGVMILIIEVTEQVRVRKEAEKLTEELKASHERTTKILEALPHMTFTADASGAIDYYNQRWYKLLGASEELVHGWGWQNYIHPEDVVPTKERWRHSVQTGEPFSTENRWKIAATGEYRWFLVRALPLRDAEGNIIQWVGTHTDIQDQKQMMLALEESTKQFKFLADSIAQMVWTTDPQGSHEYFNQRWIEYTGYTVEQSRGTEMWNRLLHPDDRARAIARWTHSLQTGEPYEVEYRFKRASDGTWNWFLGQARALKDENGNIVQWFGTCTEIEEQKRNEALIEQTNQELRSINEDLDSFVYTASHDLKLPIVNMGGIFTELMRSATFHDPDAEVLTKMFYKSLDQIQGTIQDLTEIVKVQKNIDAHKEEIVLNDLVEEVKLSIKDMIVSSDAEIICDFNQVPRLYFSRVNLKSIFYNLISNAIKYRHLERTPIVELKTSQEGEFTVLTIKDNGLGIDLNKHGAKVFQMFKRFHNHVSGSGLGLYIINRIVQKNGGRIELASEEGHGTTFTIFFKTKEQ